MAFQQPTCHSRRCCAFLSASCCRRCWCSCSPLPAAATLAASSCSSRNLCCCCTCPGKQAVQGNHHIWGSSRGLDLSQSEVCVHHTLLNWCAGCAECAMTLNYVLRMPPCRLRHVLQILWAESRSPSSYISAILCRCVQAAAHTQWAAAM